MAIRSSSAATGTSGVGFMTGSWIGFRVSARRTRQRRAQVRFGLRKPALQRVLLVDHHSERVLARLELVRGVEQRLLDVGRQRSAVPPRTFAQVRRGRRAVRRLDGRV